MSQPIQIAGEKVNALFIHYFFPPVKSIAVLRNYQHLLHISPYYANCFVFTTSNSNVMATDNTFPTVHQFPVTLLSTFDFRNWNQLLGVHDTSMPEAKNTQNKPTYWSSLKNKIKIIGFQCTKSFPTNLIVGDGAWLYILQGFFKGIALIKKENISVIHSSFAPYADHLIAYLLVRYFHTFTKKKIHWIADFRDPHVEPLYDYVFWKGLQHWCNRKILKHAHIVTAISNGVAQLIQPYHQKSIYVLRNGLSDITLQEKKTNNTEYNQQYFTICYTGNLHNEDRDPALLFETIIDLQEKGILQKDIKLVYAGKDVDKWRSWLHKYNLTYLLDYQGIVSLEQSLTLQRNSHINLLLTSASTQYTGILTGKFYEYLAAMNPIIVLIKGSSDIEFEHTVKNVQSGVVVYHQEEKSRQVLADFLTKAYQQYQKNGQPLFQIEREKLQQFHWKYMIKQYVDYLYASFAK